MSRKAKKHVTMLVTVSGPHWMTAVQARQNVRDLINHQAHTGTRHWDSGDEIDQYNFRVSKLSPKKEEKR